jgi:nitrite reductase/ring-hydroxylating ferredoxin subunit
MMKTVPALVIVVFAFFACNPDLSDDPIPFTPFSPLLINTNLPQYEALRTKGYVEIDDIGVKGVILHKLSSGGYVAFERNCSYKPFDACATVSADISGFFLVDYCCNSKFDFETGNPTGGPAWRPLRKYQTSVSGSSVTITDDIVE